MNFYEIGGLSIAAILATIGLFKLELIKEIIKKITSGTEKINLLSIILLIFISVIPAIIGFNIPNENLESQPVNPQQLIQEKSDIEVYSENIKDGIIAVKELHDEHKTKKQKEDSIYNATKPQRWVYQIGDLMEDDKSIMKFYKKINNVQNICLFNDENYFFFFINEEHSEEELEASLDSLKSKVGSMTISKVNLMKFCDNSKEKLVSKLMTIGRRKDKVEIDCYTVKR